MSRGALYYHFPGKDKLFEAVLEDLEVRIAEALRAASRGHADPVEGLQAGCEAFLKLATEPSVRQILLIDAPVAIGWQKWREIDARHGFGLMKGAIQSAATAGRIRPELVDPFSHMLLAALMELALVVARADNPKGALKSGRAAIGELITKLLPRKA
jgi:AcrR family transcriptional regulator